MKDLKKVILLLFSLLFSSVVCIQLVFAYENTTFGFTIDPPPLWNINENTGIDKVPVIFENPTTGSSIEIIVEEEYGSLWDYVEAAKDVMASFDDFNIDSEGSRVIGGFDGYEIVYTFLSHKVKWVAFIEGEMGYVFNCVASESEFSDSLLYFEDSLNSFRLTSDSVTLSFSLEILIIVGFFIIAIVIILIVFFKLR